MQDTYDMADHMAAFGEDSRFVNAPDPETAPDPDCEGMWWGDILEFIYDYEQQERMWQDYADSYRDYDF